MVQYISKRIQAGGDGPRKTSDVPRLVQVKWPRSRWTACSSTARRSISSIHWTGWEASCFVYILCSWDHRVIEHVPTIWLLLKHFCLNARCPCHFKFREAESARDFRMNENDRHFKTVEHKPWRGRRSFALLDTRFTHLPSLLSKVSPWTQPGHNLTFFWDVAHECTKCRSYDFGVPWQNLSLTCNLATIACPERRGLRRIDAK